MNLRAISVLMMGLLGAVNPLEPYQRYSEGSCSSIQVQSAQNMNRAAVDSLKYIAAGSRYQLFRQASVHPRYRAFTQNDIESRYCMQRNVTTSSQGTIGTIIGFGRPLASFDIVVPPNERTGLYIDAIPRDSFPTWDILRERVTLTDNRNFAFVLTCWVGSDQVGWGVLSRTPRLDENTRRIVEQHARQLGFSRQNMVFLRQDNCELGRYSEGVQQQQFLGSLAEKRQNQPNLLQNRRKNQNFNQDDVRKARLLYLQSLQNRRPKFS